MNKIIALNHKMNLNYNDVDEYIKKINQVKSNNEILIFPSFLYLDMFNNGCVHKIGSQNVSDKEYGNYTGEVSSMQLKSMNIKYSIIGHSERRTIYNETNEIINEKVENAILNEINPIICVGESLEERNADQTLIEINNQISHAILGLDDTNMKRIIIAYEPIWTIGSGITPTIEEIEKVVDYIYDIIVNAYKLKPTILYGGSVKSQNIKEILNIKNIGGVLIGSVSSKIDEIINIIEKAN